MSENKSETEAVTAEDAVQPTPKIEVKLDPAPASEPLPPVEPVVVKRGGGFVGGVLGGLIAAGAGYGVAQYVPNGWPLQDMSGFEAALNAQKQATDALAANQSAPDMTAINTALASIEGRVAQLESRPTAEAVPTAALDELKAEIDALKLGPAQVVDAAAVQAMMQEAQAAADQIKAEAEAVSTKASAKLALAQLQAAVDSGAPFSAALAAFPDAPAVLTDAAEAGLPSLNALRDSFPEAARAAINASLRANMGDSWSDRATNFLRAQTGARSTAPHEGTDADAILSRAEAALAVGDVNTALTEVSALAEPAMAEMADWRALAQQRLAGEEAVAGLAAAIGE